MGHLEIRNFDLAQEAHERLERQVVIIFRQKGLKAVTFSPGIFCSDQPFRQDMHLSRLKMNTLYSKEIYISL